MPGKTLSLSLSVPEGEAIRPRESSLLPALPN